MYFNYENFKKPFMALGSAALMLLSASAFSETVFEESFNSGLGAFSGQGRVYTSSYYGLRLRGGSNSVVTSSSIDLSQYENVSITFTRETNGLDSGESYTFAYSLNGSSYNSIESARSVNGSTTFNLPSAVDGESINLRISLNASSYFETVELEDLVVSADPTGGTTPPTGGGSLPAVSSIEVNGPFATTQHQDVGPTGDAWVVHPSTLANNNFLHPIFVWGPGAGTGPEDYDFFLDRIASHGFVVFSEVSTGDGDEMVEGLDWLIAENNRPSSRYYQKLDTSKIAFGGHSRGSLSTFGAASDPRLTTTIHVAGGSFDGNGPNSLYLPALYIAGEDDTLATPNMEADYSNTYVPVFFTIIDDTNHNLAARNGMPAIVAWLRWHLAGETERASMFTNNNCYFCSTPYDSTSKYW